MSNIDELAINQWMVASTAAGIGILESVFAATSPIYELSFFLP
jgi:hypothetical protein